MRNIFIMHTQYNLILSAGIVSRYQNSENTLVLFSEFAYSDEMSTALASVFDRVIVVRNGFYKPKSALDEIKEIRRCLKKAKVVANEHYDNIFMSQERVFDLILCAKIKKNNPDARCYNVEEDAYYSINPKYNSEDFVYKESFGTKRRKALYALMLIGYPYNYKDVHYFYGMSSEYCGANLLFPHLARRELRDKELIEITDSELVFGIENLYYNKHVALPSADKYTLFFFDLINRYEKPDVVKAIVKETSDISKKEGRVLLFKYHPRETQKFDDIDNAIEICNIMPAEKVLYDLKESDVVVVGNATTSCVVAAKLGFRVISVCKIEAPYNTKMHEVMEKMGISCLSNMNDIQKHFEKGERKDECNCGDSC